MKRIKWSLILSLSFLVIMGFFSSLAFGSYPTRPIEMVVTFGVGGSTDIGARTIASVLPGYIGQPVVVVNKPGGGGQLGMDYFLNTRPDGYTMAMATIGPWTIYPALHSDAPFMYSDFRAIARTEIVPAVLAARPDDRFSTLDELTSFIEKNPGSLRYAIAGSGSLSDLGAKAYLAVAGIPLHYAIGIPFEGTGEALLAILGDHAQFIYANLSPLIDHIRDGSLVALAVGAPERLSELPDVPTLDELGFEEATVMGWKGICAHPDIPDDIAKMWEEAVYQATQNVAWINMQKSLGVIPAYLNGEDFEAYMKREYQSFRKIAEEAGLIMD